MNVISTIRKAAHVLFVVVLWLTIFGRGVSSFNFETKRVETTLKFEAKTFPSFSD